MYRIAGFVVEASNDAVWNILTENGTIGKYSATVRTLVRGWAKNAWAYDETGIPGELDFRLLQHIEHLRHSWTPGAASVNPWVNTGDGLKYGVNLSSELGVEVLVVGVNWLKEPQLKVYFQMGVESERLKAFVEAFGLTMPDEADPKFTSGKFTLNSTLEEVGEVTVLTDLVA